MQVGLLNFGIDLSFRPPKKGNSLQSTARNELRSRVQSLLAQLASREQEMRDETRAIEEGFSSRVAADSQPSSMEGVDDDPSSPPLLGVPQVDGIFDDVALDNNISPQPPSPLQQQPNEIPELISNLPGIVDQLVDVPENSVEQVIEAPPPQQILKDLSERMISAEPGSNADPLRYGLVSLYPFLRLTWILKLHCIVHSAWPCTMLCCVTHDLNFD